jgi:hypothetical protein
LILDRRDFLRRCGMGFGAMALGELLGSGAPPPPLPIIPPQTC